MFPRNQNDWRIYDLMVQQTQMKQGDLTVMAYTYKLKGIWTKIEHYWPVGDPKSSDRQYTLKQRVFIFLMGLNSEFEGVRSQILHRETLSDLDQAIGMVIKDEKKGSKCPLQEIHVASLWDSVPRERLQLLEKKAQENIIPKGSCFIPIYLHLAFILF